MGRWLMHQWEKEPLALIGAVVALVSLGLAIQARWLALRDCEQGKPPPVATLRLAAQGKLSFELGDINRAGLRRVVIGRSRLLDGLGANPLLQLRVAPPAGKRKVVVVLEAYGGQEVQELRVRAKHGVVQTCIQTGDRSPCVDGPVSLTIEGKQDVALLGDGVTVDSVADTSEERICWGKAMLRGLRLKNGELWIF